MEQKESYSPEEVIELTALNLRGRLEYSMYIERVCVYTLKDKFVRKSLYSALEVLSQIPPNVRDKNTLEQIAVLERGFIELVTELVELSEIK